VRPRAKRPYLVVYDYGMGGVWIFIDARNPEEIEAKYPELTVAAVRPDWLTDDRWEQIDRDAHFDIDDEPTGFLAALVEERKR
jgi:hypothetical protein